MKKSGERPRASEVVIKVMSLKLEFCQSPYLCINIFKHF